MMLLQDFLKWKEYLISQNMSPSAFVCDDEAFFFELINHCKPEDVLRVRNADNVISMMGIPRRISLSEHLHFIKNYSDFPRLDFMIISENEKFPIGGVSLCLTELGLEVGKYIGDSRFLGRGLAKAAMLNFINFLAIELPRQEVFARTRNDNKKNIILNEKLGFFLCKELPENFVLMRLELD